ncbi:MAG: transketolase [Ardenticatenaceae bacterium]|nr:transketolase [Ardenticatenaceae bacterium]MCB8987829.1 transketolase [Ardenticatenaceae bacterium]
MTMIRERQLRSRTSIKELQETAWRLSRQILEMTTEAGSGHPSSSLSAIDVMTALYFSGVMRYYSQEPQWAERDRFVLSKGHAAPALYAVLAEAGYFDPDMLSTLRDTDSPLEGHPNMRALPGVEASTGSLGQGLSIGLGHALAARLDGLSYRVYVLIGDGESDEGQIWEAAMAAAKYQVDNLTAVLDYNDFQQTGSVEDVMPSLAPVSDKWEAFGWNVREINGHDMRQCVTALQDVARVNDQPQMIIAHTRKGRGLSPFEKDSVNRKHGEALDEEELATALAELDEEKATVLAGDVEKPELTPEDVHGEV